MTNIVNLNDVYAELKKIEASMVTKENLNSLLESLSIMSNKDTMIQIEESERDIKSGNLKEVESVDDL